MSVTLSVFWGRGRYVRILWPYIERNLVANGGSVDKVILITKNRDHVAGATEARNILERNVAKYPGEVVEVEFCDRPYGAWATRVASLRTPNVFIVVSPATAGCAYDKILNRNDTVYIKIDDDIVFIRDGSVEHLVLHTLSNPDYTFYTGAVVNNPHSYGVHQFAGAFPPTTFHWRNNGRLAAPFVDDNEIETKYWGKVCACVLPVYACVHVCTVCCSIDPCASIHSLTPRSPHCRPFTTALAAKLTKASSSTAPWAGWTCTTLACGT